MSYDLGLYYDDEPAQIERHSEGGTYAIGGTTNAELTITYNYALHFYEHLDANKGLRWLYGKTGAETLQRLSAAVIALGTERDDDYWKATKGNAGFALGILRLWAVRHPKAVWQGD